LIEGFLDLDRGTMQTIVAEMNRDGSWDFDDSVLRRGGDEPKDKISNQEGSATPKDNEDDRHELSVDDVLAMVEEMAMLH
jgi:hypothetical protein